MKRIVILLFVALCGVYGEELFKDDFSGKELRQEWKQTDGRWRIGPTNTLQQIIGGPNRLGRIQLDIPMGDSFTVQARFSYIGGQGKAGFGAGFQLCVPEKAGVFYELKFAPIGKSGMEIIKVCTEEKDGKVDKRYTAIGKANTMVFEQNMDYLLKVEYRQGTIIVFIDDEEISETKDAQEPIPDAGKLCLFTYGASASFDNLVISK